MPAQTTLLPNARFRAELAREVELSAQEGWPYAVLAFLPQHLPGEHAEDVVEVVSSCVRDLMRDEDIAGRVSGDVIAVGLPDDGIGAQVFASRFQSDLSMRSIRLRNTLWEVGWAVLPRDGGTADELLAAAVKSAKTRRRRLATI